jgi:hypothetical protein
MRRTPAPDMVKRGVRRGNELAAERGLGQDI